MELAADIADAVDERPLDIHVAVFQVFAELEVAGGNLAADLFETGDDLMPLVVGEDAHLGEHVGVGDGSADVVGVESAVEAHAFSELLDAMVGRGIENTTPRFGCQRRIRQKWANDAHGNAHRGNKATCSR